MDDEFRRELQRLIEEMPSIEEVDRVIDQYIKRTPPMVTTGRGYRSAGRDEHGNLVIEPIP